MRTSPLREDEDSWDDAARDEPDTTVREEPRTRPLTGSASPGARPRPVAPPTTLSLTSRGAIVLTWVLSMVGFLAGAPFGSRTPMGFMFVAGCVGAALWTRRPDLLKLAVTPPLTFFVATCTGELIGALGESSLLQALAIGIVTTLAGTAPWLFAGTTLTAVITLPRGAFADVRAILRSRRERSANPVQWDEAV